MKNPIKTSVAWTIVIIFCLSFLPLVSQEKQKPVSLKGFIYWAEKKTKENKEIELTLTPIKDAVVLMRSTADNQEYKSPATPEDGSYIMKDLPPGTYVPGIIKENKTYNVDGYIRLDPGENAIISFYLEKNRKSPAIIPIKQGFFQTPWGFATMAAGTATAGIIIYSIIKPEEEVSPTRR